METKSEREKQIEAILGHELDEATIRGLRDAWIPIATRVYSYNDASVTWRHFLLPLPKWCASAPIVDVCGYAWTGNDGKAVFQLNQFVCPEGRYAAPINVVATAESIEPQFLTIEHSLMDSATDIEIKVYSWNANGKAAPNVLFDWRCQAVYLPNVYPPQ